jgi:hypothetical protein
MQSPTLAVSISQDRNNGFHKLTLANKEVTVEMAGKGN